MGFGTRLAARHPQFVLTLGVVAAFIIAGALVAAVGDISAVDHLQMDGLFQPQDGSGYGGPDFPDDGGGS